MEMKHAKAAVAAFLLLALPAGAAPRLSQILPQTQIPDRAPVIVDLFGFGRPDIFFNSSPSQGTLEDNALFIRNLGNRTFDQPRFTNFRYSAGGITDEISSLATPGPFTGKALFFNAVNVSGTIATSTPTVLSLDALGRIQPRRALVPSAGGRWITVDLDGDGVSGFLEGSLNAENENELLIHDRQADGSYATTTIPIDSSLSLGKATAIDLDGDGDRDLVITPDSGSFGLTIVERTGPRDFSPTTIFMSDASPESTFADLDGDGLPDILSDRGDPFVYSLNQGGLDFSAPLSFQVAAGYHLMKAVPQPQEPAVLRFSGFNNGTGDLVSVRFGTWETLSNQPLAISALDPNSAGPRTLALNDFDGDGHDDALILTTTNVLRQELMLNARRLSIAWGNGAGFAPAAYIHPPPVSNYFHVSGNFDSHPGEDLIIGPDTDGNFAFLLNTGEGTFPLIRMVPEIQPPAGAPEGTLITQLHAGDLDGDGKTDLAIDYEKFISGEGYRTACGISKGNGDGTFQPPVLPANAFGIVTKSPCGITQLIDWDGDGDLDAIGSGAWRENLGGRFDGTFRALIAGVTTTDLFGNTAELIQTYAGDLDGDGFADIASLVYSVDTASPPEAGLGGAIPESTMAVAFNDGLGGISSISEFPANLAGTDIFGNPIVGVAFFADLNADGLPDLVTGELGGTDIFGNIIARNFWRRNPGGGSRNPGSWVKIALIDNGSLGGPLRDFDGDGVLESVAPTGFTRPDPLGPLVSPTFDLIAPVRLSYTATILSGDFDGDDDADFLLKTGDFDLVLLRNPSVDERSAITRRLIAMGAKGSLAGPDQDADGDGRSNFAEIIGRTNPLSQDEELPDPFGMRVGHSEDGDGLHFTIPAGWGSDAILWDYEISTDLRIWTPVSTVGRGVYIRDGAQLHGYVNFAASGALSAFYRLTAVPLVDPF